MITPRTIAVTKIEFVNHARNECVRNSGVSAESSALAMSGAEKTMICGTFSPKRGIEISLKETLDGKRFLVGL
jgi:hypothetical protein